MLLQWPWPLTHQDQCNSWQVAVLVLRDRNCPLSKTMQGEATSRSGRYNLGKDAPGCTRIHHTHLESWKLSRVWGFGQGHIYRHGQKDRRALIHHMYVKDCATCESD